MAVGLNHKTVHVASCRCGVVASFCEMVQSFWTLSQLPPLPYKLTSHPYDGNNFVVEVSSNAIKQPYLWVMVAHDQLG